MSQANLPDPPLPPPPDTAQARLHARQHSIFAGFPPWTGKVSREFWATPYGSLVRRGFRGNPPASEDYEQAPRYPDLDEEYFEWVDLLETVALAGETYTMLELGAGHGRWVVAAATVLRRHRPEVRPRLAAFEPDHGHYEMLWQHFLDNGLRPDEHLLVEAAVSDADGTAFFTAGHSEEWWGQSVVSDPGAPWLRERFDKAAVVPVPAISLPTILAPYPLVDLIDMDLQGHEAIVCKAAAEDLDRCVQRIHVGTHSQEIEGELRSFFTGLGWLCYYDFPCHSTVPTQFGAVAFEDGVQTWINPNLVARGRRHPPSDSSSRAASDSLNSTPEESPPRILVLQNSLHAQARRLAELNDVLAELRGGARSMDLRLTELQGELDAMRRSLSWRVTSPLRWLKRMARSSGGA